MDHNFLSFVDMSFSTSLAILDLIHPITDRIGQQFGLDEDSRYWIWLATQEALNNAVKHGNKMDPEKVVFFRIDMHEHELIITIKDQGEGFDPADVPDPTNPDNLLKASGRGLFYIHKFMDHVSFITDHGTKVTMKKRI